MKHGLGRLAIVCVIILWGLFFNINTAAANELFGYHNHGDCKDTHGMVLFGEHQHYLAHIPMFQRPHNEQLIFLVKLEDGNGNAIQSNFSSGTHSLLPKNEFSLDNIILTKDMTFKADVHQGNFEHGGPRLLEAITVRVEQILVARNLPVAGQATGDTAAENTQEYYLFGAPGDVYLANYIRSNRAFQQILKVAEMSGVPALSSNQATRMTAAAASRLTLTNETFSAKLPKAGTTEESTPVQFKLATELWCLKGPGFFNACDPVNSQ